MFKARVTHGWHGHPMLGDRASLGKSTVTQRRVAVPPSRLTRCMFKARVLLGPAWGIIIAPRCV